MSLALSLLLAFQTTATEPPALIPELRPLAFLVGSCWRATFPGTSQTNTHCYTPMHGGRNIRNRHTVDGTSYSGETIFRWDSAARQIRYDYWGSDGGYSTGVAAPTAEGISYPEEVYLGADGRELRMRASMTGITADGYDGASELREGESWREMWRMRFTRVGPAPTAD